MTNYAAEIDRQVIEILSGFGSKERLVGTVVEIDEPGHTIHIIDSSGQIFFAFTDSLVAIGDLVSFRRDGYRAKEIKVEQPPTSGEE